MDHEGGGGGGGEIPATACQSDFVNSSERNKSLKHHFYFTIAQ